MPPAAESSSDAGTGSSAAWVARDAAVVWHGFTAMAAYPGNDPVVVERGEGRELIDVAGRRYFDAVSSIWVTTLGHHVPELDAAITEQLGRIAHSTMLGNGNRATIEFAEALAKVVPVDRPHFLFASDGASAVEQALRIAFQYWTNQGVTCRTRFLALDDAYHGDTVGSLSVGAGGFGTTILDPLRFPVVRAPGYRDPDGLRTAARLVAEHATTLAAVIIEPYVQGSAGMVIADPAAFGELARACTDHDVLLICDEVATGFGRTGTLFASEQCGLRPDLLCLGKGITGGYLPMSATVASQRVFDAFLGADLSEQTLYHGHSYGGNALAAAVGLRHLSLLTEDVLRNVRERSAQLRGLLDSKVAGHPAVKEIRLAGLMGGIELVDAADAFGGLLARRVCAAMVRSGVLSRSIGDVVTLVPPLTTTAGEINLVVDVLAAALAEVVPL